MTGRPPRVRLRCAVCAVAGTLAFVPCAARAGELIVGEAKGADGSSLDFRITGNSPSDVVGGDMVLGEARFTIQRVSSRGLIGGTRIQQAGDASFAEYAVFSSSFSAQTAVGQPYVAARRYHHCDQPYNSFLAVYRVNGQEAVKALGPAPYSELIEDTERSDDATVYCFMSTHGQDR